MSYMRESIPCLPLDPIDTAMEPSSVEFANGTESFMFDRHMVELLQSALFEKQTIQNQTNNKKKEYIPQLNMSMSGDSVNAMEADPLCPEDFHTCQECMSSQAIICTGCGQTMCMRHAYDDEHGGKGTYGSSPGGLICANCMLYHYY